MKITWNEVAARFNFDDRQTIIGEYLVNRGKDACLELWASEPDEGGPAPVDFAAQLKAASPIPHDPETGRLVVEYLTTKKKRGAASSYLQLQYETEQPIKKDIARLLDPDQAAAFKTLEVGSLLLDVDTGYSPIDDRIAVLIDRMRSGQAPHAADVASSANAADWPMSLDPLLRITGVTEYPSVDLLTVCAALSLNTRHATVLRYRLDWLQNQCAELWSTVTHDYSLSPLEFIVDRTWRGDGDGRIDAPLTHYLRAARKLGSDRTYFELQHQLEHALHQEMSRMLSRNISAPLHALSIGSFLNIATGHAPIAARLSQLRDENRLKRGIDLFCGMPFEYVHIEDTGDVLPCCPSKFRLSIGNLKQDTMYDVWNGRAAQAVRESIHDKSFRFCNYYACEYLKEGRNKHARK